MIGGEWEEGKKDRTSFNGNQSSPIANPKMFKYFWPEQNRKKV